MGMSNEDYLKKIIKELGKIDYIKPDEIPSIDLYMDQVTTFMDEHLKASKRYEEDKLLTKTMINNYTKNNLLPAPNKKKYSKEHMLLLIFIYYFKNVLSISDIQNVFNPLTEKFYDKKSNINLETIYNEVFSLEKEQIDILTKDIIRKYARSKDTFADAEYDKDREFLNTFSFICMLSFDVYVKKMIIERLIDQTVSDMKARQSKSNSMKSESKKTDAKNTEPKKTDAKNTEPRKSDVKNTEPKKTDVKNTEPRKTNVKKTEPKKTEPKKTEPEDGIKT